MLLAIQALRMAAKVVQRWNALDQVTKEALGEEITGLKAAVVEVRTLTGHTANHLGAKMRARADERLLTQARNMPLDVQLGKRLLIELVAAAGGGLHVSHLGSCVGLPTTDQTFLSALERLTGAKLVDRHLLSGFVRFRTVEVWYAELPALRCFNLHESFAQSYADELVVHGVMVLASQDLKMQGSQKLRPEELAVILGASVAYGLEGQLFEWYGISKNALLLGLPQDMLNAFSVVSPRAREGSLETALRPAQKLLAISNHLWSEMDKSSRTRRAGQRALPPPNGYPFNQRP